MKIVKTLRDIHRDCLPNYQILGEEVEALLKAKVEQRRWFFLSRLKTLQSFALKIESGRVQDPSSIEDFFACTIVVATIAQIQEAEKLILDFFDLSYRRPKNDSTTHKSSSDFPFDDLRLYVARRAQVSGKHPDLNGLVFEVQIKTTLQHAWSLATHDLIYKTNTVSWPLERIAYQVKAMLEHAEIAIDKADSLAGAAGVSKCNNRTDKIFDMIENLKNTWDEERLPDNVKRLAETVLELFHAADISINKYDKVMETEERRIGLIPADLSPYAFVLQAVAHFDSVRFQHKFNRSNIRTAILVHSDMDLPSWMHKKHPRIIRA